MGVGHHPADLQAELDLGERGGRGGRGAAAGAVFARGRSDMPRGGLSTSKQALPLSGARTSSSMGSWGGVAWATLRSRASSAWRMRLGSSTSTRALASSVVVIWRSLPSGSARKALSSRSMNGSISTGERAALCSFPFPSAFTSFTSRSSASRVSNARSAAPSTACSAGFCWTSSSRFIITVRLLRMLWAMPAEKRPTVLNRSAARNSPGPA